MMVLKSCVRLSLSGVGRWSVRASHWLAVKIAQLLDTGLFFARPRFLTPSALVPPITPRVATCFPRSRSGVLQKKQRYL